MTPEAEAYQQGFIAGMQHTVAAQTFEIMVKQIGVQVHYPIPTNPHTGKQVVPDWPEPDDGPTGTIHAGLKYVSYPDEPEAAPWVVYRDEGGDA